MIARITEPLFGLKVASKGTWDVKRHGNLEQGVKNGVKSALRRHLWI